VTDGAKLVVISVRFNLERGEPPGIRLRELGLAPDFGYDDQGVTTFYDEVNGDEE